MAKLPARVVQEMRYRIVDLIEQGSTIYKACETVGYGRQAFWQARQDDPDLQAAYEAALLARTEANQEIVRHEAIRVVTEGREKLLYEVTAAGERILKSVVVERSPSDIWNAAKITGLIATDRVQVEHSGEVGSPDVAAAIERFTALTAAAIRAAAGERPALPAGDTDA